MVFLNQLLLKIKGLSISKVQGPLKSEADRNHQSFQQMTLRYFYNLKLHAKSVMLDSGSLAGCDSFHDA